MTNIVAIDGPAGAGKSTVARLLAGKLGVVHLDTGATYRLVGWRALEEGVPLDDAHALAALAERVARDCALADGGVLLYAGVPVGDEIRSAQASDAASRVAALAAVREVLVPLQRRLVPAAGAVVEGRDVGTVVLPAADLKVYLDADEVVRAARRSEAALTERDARDAGRSVAPMRPADDAILIDTTSRTPEEVVRAVIDAMQPRAQSTQLTQPSQAEPPARRAVRMAVWWMLHVLLRTAFRLHLAGRQHVPARGAAILAVNHRSLLDIPATAMLTRRKVWFMGKSELFEIPVFGRAIAALGGFPVRRGRPDRRSLNTALELLRNGEIVCVYPEGTRTPEGRFERVEDGFAYLALRSGAPVIPVALSGTQAVFPPGRRLPKLVRIRGAAFPPAHAGGPLTGVVPRSKLREAATNLQAALKAAIDELEPLP